MSRSLTVTRTLLSLSTLQVWNPPSSIIVGDSFMPGGQTHRREFATSPYVPGRFLIGATRDMQEAVLRVELTASTGAALSTLVATTINAFTQYSYTLTWDFDGLTSVWECEAADWTPGEAGVLEDLDLSLHATQVVFLIPHNITTGAF